MASTGGRRAEPAGPLVRPGRVRATTTAPTRGRLPLLVGVAALAVALGGCGEETADTAVGDAAQPEAPAGPTSPGASATSRGPDLSQPLVADIRPSSDCRLAEAVGAPDDPPPGSDDPALVDLVLAGVAADPVVGVDRGPFVAVDVEGSDATVLAVAGLDEVPEPNDERAQLRFLGGAWIVRPDAEPRVTSADNRGPQVSTHPLEQVDTTSDVQTPVADALISAQTCSFIAASAYPRPDPAPVLRPDLVRAEPATARPGQEVELYFPEETGRGIAYELDRQVDDGWETTHRMTAATADGGGVPRTVPVGTAGYGYPDIGVGGPGPDTVVLPDDLAPGDYRICTANAGADFCTPLTVEDGGEE